MNENLKNYLKEQEKLQANFKTKLSLYKDELDATDLLPYQKIQLVKKFKKDSETYRTLSIKYDNFILDIRKPSFLWFCIWLAFSFLGLVTFIKFIIMIFV